MYPEFERSGKRVREEGPLFHGGHPFRPLSHIVLVAGIYKTRNSTALGKSNLNIQEKCAKEKN